MIWLLIGISLFIFVIWCWKDISNYRYTKSCFKLVMSNPIITRKYENIRLTWLGILYYYYPIPIDNPDKYDNELIAGNALYLDNVLTGLNLDGIARMDTRMVGEDEKFRYALVKVIPVFEKLSVWTFIKSVVIAAIIEYLIYKFRLFDYKDVIYNYLKF